MKAQADVSRSQVVAFRAANHGLSAGRSGRTLSAAAPVGQRPTRTRALAFAARAAHATEVDVTAALDAKDLVDIYGPRGTRLTVPSEDVGIFTIGALPVNEPSFRAAIPGAFLSQLDAARMTVTDAVAAVVESCRRALGTGPRPRVELARAVTAAVPTVLAPPCRGRCPNPHVESSLFDLAGVSGTMCFRGATDSLIALDQWLDISADQKNSREGLSRRWLHCYGPSSAATFAGWAGISSGDARQRLRELSDETIDVSVDHGKARVLLAADLGRLSRPQPPDGVRFLPPGDAYLLDRDRATLLPDRAAQRRVWRPIGNTGAVLVDGELCATWTTRQRRGWIDVVVEPLMPEFRLRPADLHNEAQLIATARGRTDRVEVAIKG